MGKIRESIQKRDITSGEIFHVLNRGVDKRDIFLEEKDYFRFIHNLFEFNDIDPVTNSGHRLNQNNSIDFRNRYIRKPRKLLVEILAFCLMPNHFHLMLRQKLDSGLIKFMHKLGAGYANYFNQKYQRTGALFEGRYKLILVNKEPHFIHLPYYIHFNPLDLVMPEWRNKKIKDYRKAIKFLESYRWSSHLDYAGIKNFPSLTQREFLSKIFRGPGNYRKMSQNWLQEMNLEAIKDSTLE